MNDTFDYIMRFAIVVFSYCCAVLAVGWFLAAILFRNLGIDSMMNDFVFMANDAGVGPFWAETSFWSSVFVSGFVMATIAGGFSFIPAVIIIILAEARGYRESLFCGNDRGRYCRRLRLLAACRPQCRAAFIPPDRLISTLPVR
ncbi:hypothetical protein C001_00381 [Brucella sp. F5/06]|nr:hypothetical protein C001_00381 [Brucella sp. F5/06]